MRLTLMPTDAAASGFSPTARQVHAEGRPIQDEADDRKTALKAIQVIRF